MANKPKVPPTADDKEQSERFIEAARKHGTDETGKTLERIFKRAPPKAKRPSK
jgi:hypothetical protein